MRFRRTLLTAVIALFCICGCVGRDPDLGEPRYVELVVGKPAAGASLPLIFGIHGLGDRPELFARVFAAEFPIPARLVFPRGADPLGEGFSWFPIPVAGASDWAATADGISQAGERLAMLVERLTREYGPAARPVVFGYSQGGILSFYLAARHPELVSAAVPMAGFLPSTLLTESRPAPTYAFHGAADDLVPVDAARATVHAFTERGGIATLVEYPRVGHLATVAMVRALQRKVAELAAPAS